ncbi:Core-2/I-branching beta-1,6-N-acetylglucosaminyltransferase family protein [Striga asiatica]|uniref:Core-2/I-branching beta-1,6-N-acetylglucosaminyltransferase family protein n=1 Tax=Striga asiatica TaxID=4170 RepID=A0A5A7PUE8_STRAF|nr:Core-2/I-branching beta-1,6-N-acetylglucosaminyltransferase family protein [Striga asiatica]
MKSAQAWRLGMKNMQMLPGPRQRGQLKKPTWIIVLVSLVSLFLVCAYVYPPQNSAACYLLSSHGCKALQNWLPPVPARELSDDEFASRVVIRDILAMHPNISANPKIAFLFLTPGALPFERLWDKFFQGHEGRFSVYVHASKDKPVHFSRYFINREIRSSKVAWGKISMVDAERRLLANALKDPDNQHFVLLSDSCIPLRNFDYVYNYLMYTNVSFVDWWLEMLTVLDVINKCYGNVPINIEVSGLPYSNVYSVILEINTEPNFCSFDDPGPHGTGRYSENMLPEVEKKDFRKGAQVILGKMDVLLEMKAKKFYTQHFSDLKKHSWFTMKRQHALIIMADSLYYSKFRDYCRPGMEKGRNCYSDEHYLPTFFHMLDPGGIANWSVTHVDWSEGKWHPKSYSAQDVTFELMRNITSIVESVHVTSEEKKEIQIRPCLWNGNPRPCYLFGRKFMPETIEKLIRLFPNYTSI